MAEIRETEVARDSQGRVIGQTERIVDRPRKGGGFGWGLIFGVAIVAIGVIAFAYTQGSFQTAGARADGAAAQAERRLDQTAQNAGQAIENAGDHVEQVTDNAAN